MENQPKPKRNVLVAILMAILKGLGKLLKGFLSFCAKHALNPIILLIILVLLLGSVITSISLGARTVTKTDSRTVQFGLRNIGELATQVGFFTNVQTIENNREVFGVTVPLTNSKYIYSYDGNIKVGFNFEKIEVNTDESKKLIQVRIPAPIVMSVDVDEHSMKIYHQAGNIFTPLDLNEVGESREKLKEEVLQTAKDNGIFEKAEDNLKLLLTGFLSGTFDLKEYRIEFSKIEEH